MKKMKLVSKILAVTVMASLLLCGCGGATSVSEKSFQKALENDLGNPSDVVTTCKAFGEFGLSESDFSGGDDVRLSGAYKVKVKADEMLPWEEYIVDNLGEKKIGYYGAYVLSKDEGVAGQMRDNYMQDLEKWGWQKVETSVWDTNGAYANYALYTKDNNAVIIQDITGPLNWDKELENSSDNYYGTYVWFY